MCVFFKTKKHTTAHRTVHGATRAPSHAHSSSASRSQVEVWQKNQDIDKTNKRITAPQCAPRTKRCSAREHEREHPPPAQPPEAPPQRPAARLRGLHAHALGGRCSDGPVRDDADDCEADQCEEKHPPHRAPRAQPRIHLLLDAEQRAPAPSPAVVRGHGRSRPYNMRLDVVGSHQESETEGRPGALGARGGGALALGGAVLGEGEHRAGLLERVLEHGLEEGELLLQVGVDALERLILLAQLPKVIHQLLVARLKILDVALLLGAARAGRVPVPPLLVLDPRHLAHKLPDIPNRRRRRGRDPP
mmetsp:Transcript_30222/g.74293  ORF Transcript_30222/g.74293 Transcript_30222/m.74293 type:complete len:304 (+) Transcript_30222:18-929(+)